MTSRDDRAPGAVGWKFVIRPGWGAELYDLVVDPDELMKLAHAYSSRAPLLSGELARIVHGWSSEELLEPDAETREKLMALGCVR